MSGCIWKFSDQIDDVDVEMLRRDFVTFREAMEYYGLNEKPVVRLAREAGSVYKIGKMVRIRRSRFEEYLRQTQYIGNRENNEGQEQENGEAHDISEGGTEDV